MTLSGGFNLDLSVAGEIAWTLIHFIWQGLLLAALLVATLRWIRPAAYRYFICCAVLVLMALAPVVTYWSLQGRFDDPGALTLPTELSDPSLAVSSHRADSGYLQLLSTIRVSLPASWSVAAQSAFPWLILVWTATAALLAVRQAAAVVWLRRMLRCDTSPLRPGYARLREIPGRMGVRRSVEFRECPLVEAPATVGWRRPVVLIPVAAFDRLSDAQLDALVAHEVAHVRRNDYLVNLLQSVLESALAFNPAVWWVSARIREEREVCCDEVAASAVGSRKTYADALATMDKVRAGIGLPAAGVLSAAGGPLLRRIRRLAMSKVGMRGSPANGIALFAPLITISLLFFTTSHLVATGVNVKPLLRGLADVQSLSGQIYSALGITARRAGGGAGNADLLESLSRAVNATTDDGKTFDNELVSQFVRAALADPRPDALSDVQLPLVCVSDNAMPYERDPNWKYGRIAMRLRLERYLLDRAAGEERAQHLDAARDHARAALLLAAQDASAHGTLALGKVVGNKSLQRLAQLTPREVARVNRALADHRQLLEVGQREMAKATRALRSLHLSPPEAGSAEAPTGATGVERLSGASPELDAARDDLMSSYSALLSLSRGRPDLQLTAARLCWQSRLVLAGEDAAIQRRKLRDLTAEIRSPHLERWIDEALHEAPPPTLPYPPRESPEMVRARVANWGSRGMMR